MFNEIELLESIVQDHLCSYQVTPHDNVSGSYDIANLDKLIRKALITNVFELKKDQLIELYIQDIHKRFITLSNNLYTFAVSKPNLKGNQSQVKIENCETILNTIENLLIFVGNSFPKYINPEIYITENQKDKAASYFKDLIIQLEKSFKEQNELLEIALNPVRKFIETKHAISYHLSGYFDFLLQELSQFNGSLKERLISLNFNNFSFLHYLTREIENEMEEQDFYSGKMEKLYWTLKWVKQIQITKEAYNASLQPIKNLLIDWLNEEINYLEKSIVLEKLPKADVETSENKDFKLITDLSVPQLAFL